MGVGKIAIVSGVPHPMLHDEHNRQVVLFPLVALSLGVTAVVLVLAAVLAGFSSLQLRVCVCVCART